MFSWEELPEMRGRRVLITGATSGIVRAAALQMAGLGAEVAIIGRDPARTRSTAQEIAAAGEAPRTGAGYFLADLRLLSDARRVAEEGRVKGGLVGVGGPPARLGQTMRVPLRRPRSNLDSDLVALRPDVRSLLVGEPS